MFPLSAHKATMLLVAPSPTDKGQYESVAKIRKEDNPLAKELAQSNIKEKPWVKLKA